MIYMSFLYSFVSFEVIRVISFICVSVLYFLLETNDRCDTSNCLQAFHFQTSNVICFIVIYPSVQECKHMTHMIVGNKSTLCHMFHMVNQYVRILRHMCHTFHVSHVSKSTNDFS